LLLRLLSSLKRGSALFRLLLLPAQIVPALHFRCLHLQLLLPELHERVELIDGCHVRDQSKLVETGIQALLMSSAPGARRHHALDFAVCSRSSASNTATLRQPSNFVLSRNWAARS
jgi:hypothetical protein